VYSYVFADDTVMEICAPEIKATACMRNALCDSSRWWSVRCDAWTLDKKSTDASRECGKMKATLDSSQSQQSQCSLLLLKSWANRDSNILNDEIGESNILIRFGQEF